MLGLFQNFSLIFCFWILTIEFEHRTSRLDVQKGGRGSEKPDDYGLYGEGGQKCNILLDVLYEQPLYNLVLKFGLIFRNT
jgi:hypothetical protein